MLNSSIIMREKYGWEFFQNNNTKIWFFNDQKKNNSEKMISDMFYILCKPNTTKNDIIYWIKKIPSHFSIVVESGTFVIAAVDRVCTVPIFVVMRKNEILISNYAPMLKKKCAMGSEDLDLSAGLEIYMSGYTIGSKTLYKGLERLEAGECVVCHKGLLSREYYYTYSPWKLNNTSPQNLRKKFTDVCFEVLTNLKDSVDGRQIVIPLSAGNDSRLIASGLKELGVKNVVCFTYGRKGSFELPASRSIADKLGYKWLYIPDNIKNKRNFFKSDVFRKYVHEFESYAAIPNVQDIYEVSQLRQNSLIDAEAVIVNGNSGDFISGGHVNVLLDGQKSLKSMNELNWELFLDKHYSLWRDCRTAVNDSYIISELEKILSLRNISPKSFNKYQYAIMECIELIGRQSKIVTGQQRAYEYFGYDWRLPLWSNEMLAFWETVPYEDKINQNLYIETLHENNWGDVWLDIKVNNKVIKPITLRWIRMLFKVLFVLAGKSKWNRFDKNVFEYFIHPSHALTIEPYFRVLFDFQGHRGTNSWLSRNLLKANGVNSVHTIVPQQIKTTI